MNNVMRPGLPPLPLHMQRLALDHRGYPVPWFVAWIDGKPDFRVSDGEKWARAVTFDRCWICGEVRGHRATFVIGPMCVVNRTTSEPPCHHECAVFAAIACPFLALPTAKRRYHNLPDEAVEAAGITISRNPGVTLLWTTGDWRVFRVDREGIASGKLIRLGKPTMTEWFREGRLATREECLASINSGFPLLLAEAEKEGPAAVEALNKASREIEPFLPTEGTAI